MNKEEKIIQEIRNGNKKLLGKIYSSNIADFKIFARKYQMENELIKDVYQESMIVLYENIISGKLTKLQSSIKTYLFAIGKYKLIQHLRLKEKNPFIHFDDISLLYEFDSCEEKEEEGDNISLIQNGYRQLGEKCQQILRMFYYEGKKLDEIQQQLDYDSKDTVKSQKSRCLRQLKNIIISHEKQ